MMNQKGSKQKRCGYNNKAIDTNGRADIVLITANTQHLSHAGHRSKHIIYTIKSFNLHTILWLYKRGNWDTERLSNLPKFIPLVSDGARIWTQAVWFQSINNFTSTMYCLSIGKSFSLHHSLSSFQVKNCVDLALHKEKLKEKTEIQREWRRGKQTE